MICYCVLLCCTPCYLHISDFLCNSVSSLDDEEKSGTAVLYFMLIDNLEFTCSPVSSSGDDTFSDIHVFPILCTTDYNLLPTNSKYVNSKLHFSTQLMLIGVRSRDAPGAGEPLGFIMELTSYIM